jgi:hypothetical protein
MQAHLQRRPRGADGLLPFSAQMWVSVPCRPTRASSWRRISAGLPAARTAAGSAAVTRALNAA